MRVYANGQFHTEFNGSTHSSNTASTALFIGARSDTGGTAYAACNLINKAKAECVEVCFIINLKALEGEKKLKNVGPIYSVLEF